VILYEMAYNGSELYYEGSSSDTATAPHRFKQKQGKKNTLEERVREYTGYLQVRSFFLVFTRWLAWVGLLGLVIWMVA
jgi:hypothetical protein